MYCTVIFLPFSDIALKVIVFFSSDLDIELKKIILSKFKLSDPSILKLIFPESLNSSTFLFSES